MEDQEQTAKKGRVTQGDFGRGKREAIDARVREKCLTHYWTNQS